MAGGITPSASAESSATSSECFREDSTVWLNEVNVVALKQEAQLRDEAVASTLLVAPELDRENAFSVKRISELVPNFYVPDYGSRITSTMYVRGIGARMDQPAVGLNVDNVPVLNKNAFDFDLADIATVEMLRGPQSALYGRNTIGGLMNITTLSALNWQGWRFSFTGASAADLKASAGWYHKFSPKMASALTANFSSMRGFFVNEFNGRHVDHERYGALRHKFDWRPSAKLSFMNVATASLLRQGGYPYQYVPTGRIEYNDTCFYRRFVFNDGLTLRANLGPLTLASITSVQYIRDNMTLDQDFLPQSYFVMSQRQREGSVTQDFLLTPSSSTASYHWSVGLFSFYKNCSMQAPVTFKDAGIGNLIESHRNDANPDYPIRWDERSFPLNSDFTIPSYGAAIYHESKYSAARWKFSLGIRLDWEMSRLRYHSECHTGYEIYRKLPDGIAPYRHVEIDIDDRGRLHRAYLNWMPRLSALYSLSDAGESNLYASVAKGYKAGGFNTQMFSDVLQQRLMGVMGIGAAYDVDRVVGYKPEYSWNYEVGAHLVFSDVRLRGDVSAFYIDCRDQQLTMFPDGTTTGRIMTNAGHTRSCGAEISLAWNPLEALDVNATYGFTDARFVDFFNGKENFKGKRIPYAPANTLFLSAAYTFHLDDSSFLKSLSFSASMRGVGKIWWNESNSLSQPFYLLPSASIEAAGEKWELQLWAENLSSTHYHTFYFMSMGNEFLQRGRPLQVGVTLRLRFPGS